MNGTLFKQMMRMNLRGFLNYGFGSAFYILLMFWLYPGIATNAGAIDSIVASMPEGVGRAFGLNGFGTADAFISGEFYGLILVLILSIVSVQLATKLMARLVDQGSMAYLLSTPTTRGRIAFTQAAVLTVGLLLILGITTLAGFAGNAWFLGEEHALHAGKFVELNVAAFLLFFAVGGLSFLISSVAADEKRALGTAGAITFGFYSLDLLGKLSERIEWVRGASLFALYRPAGIINGTADLLVPFLAMAAVGLVSFGLAIVLFRRRDLSL